MFFVERRLLLLSSSSLSPDRSTSMSYTVDSNTRDPIYQLSFDLLSCQVSNLIFHRSQTSFLRHDCENERQSCVCSCTTYNASSFAFSMSTGCRSIIRENDSHTYIYIYMYIYIYILDFAHEELLGSWVRYTMICSGCFIILASASSSPKAVVTFRFVVLPQIQLQPHCFVEHVKI